MAICPFYMESGVIAGPMAYAFKQRDQDVNESVIREVSTVNVKIFFLCEDDGNSEIRCQQKKRKALNVNFLS